MGSLVIFKGICIFLFVLIFAMLLGGLLGYWRDVHNVLEPSVSLIGRPKVNQDFPGLNKLDGFGSDEVLVKYKLGGGCSEENCKWPDNTGFVGDKAVIAFLSLAVVLYVINIIIMIASMLLPTFPPKASFINPILCFIGTVFMIIAVIVFGCNYNRVYEEFDHKLEYNDQTKKMLEDQGYGVHDYWISRPFSLKITFGGAFYCIVVDIVFSVFGICVSGAIAAMGPKLDNIKMGGGGGGAAAPSPPLLPPPPPPAQGQGHVNIDIGLNAAARTSTSASSADG